LGDLEAVERRADLFGAALGRAIRDQGRDVRPENPDVGAGFVGAGSNSGSSKSAPRDRPKML